MNSWRLSVAFLVMSLSATQNLLADTQFLPYASIGWASYELELIVPGEPSPASKKAGSDYIVGGVGAVIATGNWYFDTNYSSSLNAEADDGSGEEIYFLRTDIRLTIGYFIQENTSLFGGYTVGESELKAIDGTGSVITFTASGPYGGISFNMPHGDNMFTFAAALAVLDSDIKISFLPPMTADGFGYSFSAGYNVPVKNDAGVTFKANYQKYDYDNWSAGGLSIDNKSPETLLVLSMNYYIGF